MNNKEIEIKLKMSGITEAIKGLKGVKDETKEVEQGIVSIGGKAKENAEEIKRVGSEIMSVFGVQMGFDTIKQGISAITEGMKEAAEYTKTVAAEFADIQEALRIVATFKGEDNTEGFALKEIHDAARMGLTPQKGAAFKEEFYGYAGQFIGEGEGKKISAEQGDELAVRAGAFMTAKGIKASEGGAVFGELLQQAKPGMTNDELMQKFSQAYLIVEQAKGKPGQLLGQMGQITAEGIDTTDAAKILRVEAQRDEGTAGEHGRALLRGIRDIELKGGEGELGFKKGDNVFDKVKAIYAAAQKSGDEDKFLKEHFKTIQEFDAFQAAFKFGVKGNMFGLADQDAAKAGPDTDVKAVDKFKDQGVGKRMFTKAETAAARAEAGLEAAPAEDAKGRAERELTIELDADGRNVFQRFEPLDVFRRTIWQGRGSRNEQLIYNRAVENTKRQVTPEQEKQAHIQAEEADPLFGFDRELYLKKLVELAEKNAQKTLSAPPAQPAGRVK